MIINHNCCIKLVPLVIHILFLELNLVLFPSGNSKHFVPHYSRRISGSFELSTCLYLMWRHVFTSQGSDYQTSPVQETWHSDLTLTGLCSDVIGWIATSRQRTNKETGRSHLNSIRNAFWHQLICGKVTREVSWHCLCLPAAVRTHAHIGSYDTAWTCWWLPTYGTNTVSSPSTHQQQPFVVFLVVAYLLVCRVRCAEGQDEC